MFCPRSTTCRSGSSRVTDRGRTISTRRTGGAGDAHKFVSSRSTTCTGRNCEVVFDNTLVDALTRDQIGREDLPRCVLPALIGADRHRRPVGEHDLQLREQAQPRSVDVVFARVADLTAKPAVGKHRVQFVGSFDEQVAHVVCLHLESLGIAREPWRQFQVADAHAVAEELVDAVRRRVDAGTAHRPLNWETGAQHLCRAQPGCPDSVFIGLDPPCGPVVGAE